MSDAFDLSKLNIFGDDLKLKQVFLDVTHPVGSVYVQYPRQKNPNELFNKAGEYSSVWEMQNYDGAFFRSYGTNADPFKNETDALVAQSQSTALPEHKHTMNHSHENTTVSVSVSGSTSNTKDAYGNAKSLTGSIKYGNYVAGMGNAGIAAKDADYSGIFGIGSETLVGGTFSIANDYARALTINAEHKHDVSASGSGTVSIPEHKGDTGYEKIDSETRPKNYTVIVWKRTS